MNKMGKNKTIKANFANLAIPEDRTRETFYDKDIATGQVVEVNVYEPTEEQNKKISKLLENFIKSKQTEKDSNLLYLKIMELITDIDFGDLTDAQKLKVFENPNSLLQLVTTEISIMLVNKTRIGTKTMEYLNVLSNNDIQTAIKKAEEDTKKGSKKK